MSKNHRGKGLYSLPSRGRGTCPVCKATRIKVLYALLTQNDDKLTVCKRCRNKTVNI
ncbi:hypothetical protein GCM10008013_22540 [Paenibacillus segetis]|uniref:Uncharacterized protein n=1 Tax=Paenibacillus segetis TaxID=1325360 RepID=A0ABQ1YG50_9BACL|nr:hypothetical protein GCM10008013_22540 [Paenibacillus segetis]